MFKLLGILTLSLTANVFASTIPVSNYINSKACNQIVKNEVFTSCYDYNLKGPKAVLYTVNGQALKDADIHITKRPSFYPDNNIPVKYRSYPEDYTHSGFDRGHMANHADFDYSANLVYMTYSMANIVPQNPDLNRKTWVKAEKYERTVAKNLGYVNVMNIVVYSNQPERIGKHQVAVPSSFVKVMWNDDKNFKKCFAYQNSQPDSNDNIKDHEVSCNMTF